MKLCLTAATCFLLVAGSAGFAIWQARPSYASTSTDLNLARDDQFASLNALASYPKTNYSTLTHPELSHIDFSSLKQDDPVFLDMSWSDMEGPRAEAYLRHIQWKRRLSDAERMRWQRWAIYKRSLQKGIFQFNVEDYIKQSLQHSLKKASLAASRSSMEAVAYEALAEGMMMEGEKGVRLALTAYYSALNRKHIDDLHLFFLPDDESEVVYPGLGKARGHYDIQNLYGKLLQESKPMGRVAADILSVQVFGGVAVAYTIERVEASSDSRPGKKSVRKQRNSSTPPDSSMLLALSVLRFANKQWRIMLHHCAPFATSALTDNAAPLPDSPSASHTEESTRSKPTLEDFKAFLNKLGAVASDVVAGRQLAAAGDGSRSEAENGIVDSSSSVTKQTVQALRHLCQCGKLTVEQKNDLIADIIDRIALDQEALVETSYKVICADKLRTHSTNSKLGMAVMEDFADQCHVALQLLYSTQGRRLAA